MITLAELESAITEAFPLESPRDELRVKALPVSIEAAENVDKVISAMKSQLPSDARLYARMGSVAYMGFAAWNLNTAFVPVISDSFPELPAGGSFEALPVLSL